MGNNIFYRLTHVTATANGAAVTTYLEVPYRCTVLDIAGIVQADPGDAQTVTVTNEATVGGTAIALGVLTFGSVIAAGAIGTYVANATTGKSVLAKGSFLKFVTSADGDAVAILDMSIELDPHARTT